VLFRSGVALYEMVSGCLPYQAESTRKLENMIRSKRPARALPEDCPERLAIIVRKSLASDAKRRYPTASAFAADLECFLNNRPTIAESELQSGETNPTIESVRVIDAPNPAAMRNGPDVLWQTLLRVRIPTKVGRRSLLRGVAAGCGVLLLASAAYLYHARWKETEPLRKRGSLARVSDNDIAGDWKLYQRLSAHDTWLGWLAPSHIAAGQMRAAYAAEGDRIIRSYRESPESDTTRFN